MKLTNYVLTDNVSTMLKKTVVGENASNGGKDLNSLNSNLFLVSILLLCKLKNLVTEGYIEPGSTSNPS